MQNLPYIVITALFSTVGIWMIVKGESLGWLVLLFFGSGCVFLFNQSRHERMRKDEKVQYLNKRKAEIEEIHRLASETSVDVPENPVDVWKSMLVEEGADWAVFENGTLVICEDGKPVEESALDIIGRYTETIVGTSLGDFSVAIRPEFGVWIVSYPGNQIVNYVEIEQCSSDTAAGILARTIRESDANQRNIVYTHIASMSK